MVAQAERKDLDVEKTVQSYFFLSQNFVNWK